MTAVRSPEARDLHQPHGSTGVLALGALGVVFGDIGTSPLYALKESFAGHHPLAVDQPHVFGVLSLIFWTMMIVVTLKYVFIILRADNHGEGGSLALLALVADRVGQRRWSAGLIMLGILATALFYGDAIITPAMSVLSAVEGLEVVEPGFERFVLPLSIAILIALFVIQRHGTNRVGACFGPVMAIYFAVLAGLGLVNIAAHPVILRALDPRWALDFFVIDFRLAFLALGSVVLAVTGAEALYADMGHFGRRAISIAWLYVALPCLMINYLGQGALLLGDPRTIENPFFLMAPDALRLPLVLLATVATVIASQAVISGAYSVTQQAVQLGFLPRLSIQHTSANAIGQIYVPLVNWALLACVIALVIGFGSSANLAAAYGIAVTGTMFITALMLGVLVFGVWRWPRPLALLVTGIFVLVDGLYFASNATKVPDGGWFPLLVAAVTFTLLTTWGRGREIVRARLDEHAMPIALFAQSATRSLMRVPGTAVFLTSSREGVPHALLHNVKHNKVLHDRIIIATVAIAKVPYVTDEERIAVERIDDHFVRCTINYGFMDEVDVPAALAGAPLDGGPVKAMETSYFLGRQTLIPSEQPGMALWRERLFAWMTRNAQNAMDFFKLPTNRVVELGSQLEI